MHVNLRLCGKSSRQTEWALLLRIPEHLRLQLSLSLYPPSALPVCHVLMSLRCGRSSRLFTASRHCLRRRPMRASLSCVALKTGRGKLPKFICVYLRGKSFRLTCLPLSTQQLLCCGANNSNSGNCTLTRPFTAHTSTLHPLQLQLLLSSFAFVVASAKLFVLFGACSF